MKFLKNDIPSVPVTDYVLEVKQYCVQLGIEKNSFSHGRLHKLLLHAAISHYNSYKMTCMFKFMNKSLTYDFECMKLEKEKYVDIFCDLSSTIDPRCVNFDSCV